MTTFIDQLKRIINTGQSRAIILTGNVYDLFFDGERYVPLIEYLSKLCRVEPSGNHRGITQLIYKLNNPVECVGDSSELEAVWKHTGAGRSITDRLGETNRNATYALELLRQITECYRHRKTRNNLLILLEAADLLIPECEVNRMSLADRQRVAITHDWFSDPAFIDGGDTVILLSESRSSIHHRIARLPQVISIEVPLPDQASRQECMTFHSTKGDLAKLSEQTAGLSIHAIRQLLRSGDLGAENIAAKVEQYMTSQLGEGVVEFKRPKHRLKDVIGFQRVKTFFKKELIPGFLNGSVSGAAVAGPIGGGKTFLCEAVAAELGIPVIVLKNIRSKWYGETDQIFERLRRLLETFSRSVIFVDEADTQFGGVDDDHPTERRLTGKIQAMMSDTALKGRVIWFLMTARIHRLSPDIRRPGRMDIIIPILDPEWDDRDAFFKWTFEGINIDQGGSGVLYNATKGYSAAAFANLRAQLKAKGIDTAEAALAVCEDMVLPDIEDVRTFQTLQAKLNCTRKSLLFSPKDSGFTGFESERRKWKDQLRVLEAKGIS